MFYLDVFFSSLGPAVRPGVGTRSYLGHLAQNLGAGPKIEVLDEMQPVDSPQYRNNRSKTFLSSLSGLVSGQEAGVDPLSQQITAESSPLNLYYMDGPRVPLISMDSIEFNGQH